MCLWGGKRLKSFITIALLGIYQREMKSICSHKGFYVNIHGSMYIIAKKWKQTICLLVDEWIKKSGRWNTIQQ